MSGTSNSVFFPQVAFVAAMLNNLFRDSREPFVKVIAE